MPTNPEVVQRWLRGHRARSGTGALRTDGSTLYSYKIVIGETLADSSTQGSAQRPLSAPPRKVIYDYRGPKKVGLATVRHVCCALREGGDQVEIAAVPESVDINELRTLVRPKSAGKVQLEGDG